MDDIFFLSFSLTLSISSFPLFRRQEEGLNGGKD